MGLLSAQREEKTPGPRETAVEREILDAGPPGAAARRDRRRAATRFRRAATEETRRMTRYVHGAVVRLHQRRRRHVLQIVGRYIHETQRARHDVREHRRGRPIPPWARYPHLLHVTTRLVDHHHRGEFRMRRRHQPCEHRHDLVGGVAARDRFERGARLARHAIADQGGARRRAALFGTTCSISCTRVRAPPSGPLPVRPARGRRLARRKWDVLMPPAPMVA